MPILFIKTRIAPTPSGFLHLGNVLSFSIAAEMARRNNAKILLKIDDLDQQRVNKAYLQDIFDTLNFLDIPWDEGPQGIAEFEECFSQVHRMDNYTQALEQLANDGVVFACNCSRNRLSNPDYCTCSSACV